ncbi:baseplate J/gp47 family protein [Halomonas daqingensis]|uniref:baseplate J/gp47 family protein n=1 Tax=Billgrantia desiderata TaxID=52021 RepID=UPI001F43A169|nr:baseplate J/gp47 family protein [Halomonas desiderata]MCE8027552.1 baseplate J/gp47 family protein [Halomonas desiderata]
MPWQSPTLNQLADMIRADMRGRLPDAKPALRRALLRVVADVDAGAVHGLYGYLAWLAKQLIIDTAEAEWLERWASIWGIRRQAATAASGEILLTGTSGAQLLEGTELESDSGSLYTLDETVTLDAQGEAIGTVTAVDAGSEGNLDAGETLRLVTAVSGIDGEAEVGADGITGGAERENDDRLRERLLDRIQRQPHGGNADDYVRWAREAHPDVTRVWVFPHQPDDGELTLRLVCDDHEDIIPTAEVITAVEEHIDEVRPVAVRSLYVLAPVPVAQPFEIRLTPDTAEARERVKEALSDYLAQTAEPGGTSYREQLSGVVYIAAGDSRHEMPVPAGNVVRAANEITVLGDITWL